MFFLITSPVTGNNGVTAIGYNARVTGNNGVTAIGYNARVTGNNGVTAIATAGSYMDALRVWLSP